MELRIRILERIVQEIVENNPLVNYPDKSDIARIKMESYQEMKKEYPQDKIEYPKK